MPAREGCSARLRDLRRPGTCETGTQSYLLRLRLHWVGHPGSYSETTRTSP